MDFTVESLHTMEKEMNVMMQQLLKAVNVSSTSELSHSLLMSKLNKDPLATFVKSLANVFDNNLNLCKAAANKIDQLKTEQIENQKELIKIQQDQIGSVQETVKTEIKSWADVAKKNNDQSIQNMTVKTVKEAVKFVRTEDDKSKNFMIYGLQEEPKEDLEEDLDDAVVATFQKIGVRPYPIIRGLCRLGKKNPEKPRPVKVQLACPFQAQRVLNAAHRLRLQEGEFKTVYLAPDRTKEERAAHNKLVKEMKELIQQDPSKHYFIRNNKVNRVDKVLSSG